jgi:hypothetical protein
MLTNKKFDNCISVNPSGDSKVDAVTFSDKYIYISRHKSSLNIDVGAITKCSYSANENSYIIGDCSNSKAPNIAGAEGIKLYKNFIYVADSVANESQGALKICSFDTSGSISECRDANIAPGILNFPTNITFKGPKAYIVNFKGHNITLCDYEISTGDVKNCGNITLNFNPPLTALNSPHSISFNGNFAYISNTNGNNIIMCPLQADGSLGTCSDSGANDLDKPKGNIQFANGFAYVANSSSNSKHKPISKCNVIVDGTLSGCENSGVFNNDSSPYSIDKIP